MNNLIYDLILTSWQNISISIATQEINLFAAIFCLFLAVLLSLLGGAIGGMILAGKDISYALAARIGALFGPVGVFPAILVGLAIFKLSI